MMEGASQWQWYGPLTYAQHGDDLALLNLFKRLGVDVGTYIDVGAHHPLELSNTALLYNRGWRGINVEANANLLPRFDHMRPDDRNICAAVVGSAKPGDTVTLHMASAESGINSTVHAAMAKHGIAYTQQVSAITLPDIVLNFGHGMWPHLICIDAEGADVDILRTIPPASALVILIEAASGVGNFEADIRHWTEHNGYFVHSWCGNNMLLVQNQLKDRVC